MTDLRDLIQDLRAHAPEAPATCRALMRLAASELERRADLVLVGDLINRAPASSPRGVKGAPTC